ncbi:AbgT family transporter [Alcanivorax sp. JB21]|uniref:AbgT family transporter n=1 Tax=Alcanivorax limicola TaxID=2874102 RepID=UPI001CBC0B60|nr:AbgT family transporter [Alcanivorax limicola]MBZ2189980.1 AbgT family transporter [Alcanivorax limicola]
MSAAPRLQRWLSALERAGNRIPHPSLLFVLLCALLLPLSLLLTLLGTDATHPVSGEIVQVRSLLSAAGIREMLTGAVTNFTGFAPVGIVVVAMLGVGIAERSGLLGAALSALVRRAPQALLVPVIALAGVMSSLAIDAGYVVLIPLAALLFQFAGRHPLAGIAAGFAAVAGGFSANLLVGPLDVMLGGISTAAAQIADAEADVTATANYWFMLVSTVFVVGVVTLVTVRWIEPWLASRGGTLLTVSDDNHSTDHRALRRAGLALLAFVLLCVLLAWPESGALRDAEGALMTGPLVSHSVILIALAAAITGIVYGRTSGSLPDGKSVIESMEDTLRMLAGYLVLMFFAAQFVAWFSWSEIGLVLAIRGADFLGGLALPASVLLVSMILMMALLNLLIGSASAKWALIAPVLVPMLLLLGISPDITQAAYRVGDSSTNIITPLMPYFVLVLGFARRYQPDTGIGTLISMMLPYSLLLLGGWIIMLMLWLWTGWPLGF